MSSDKKLVSWNPMILKEAKVMGNSGAPEILG